MAHKPRTEPVTRERQPALFGAQNAHLVVRYARRGVAHRQHPGHPVVPIDPMEGAHAKEAALATPFGLATGLSAESPEKHVNFFDSRC